MKLKPEVYGALVIEAASQFPEWTSRNHRRLAIFGVKLMNMVAERMDLTRPGGEWVNLRSSELNNRFLFTAKKRVYQYKTIAAFLAQAGFMTWRNDDGIREYRIDLTLVEGNLVEPGLPPVCGDRVPKANIKIDHPNPYKVSCVYRIRNIRNGMCYYGHSINLQNRIGVHLAALARGDHYNTSLQADYNVYGDDNFIVEVIEYEDNELLLQLHEQKHIDLNRSRCYNAQNAVAPHRRKSMLKKYAANGR